jgi:hypothetical protein
MPVSIMPLLSYFQLDGIVFCCAHFSKLDGEIIMESKSQQNLKKLIKTPILMNFVKKHEGVWNHSDWENLLAQLKEKGYSPIDADQLGLKLEEKKELYLASK